jgi:hypothetical protein
MAPQNTRRIPLRTIFLKGPGVCKNRIILSHSGVQQRIDDYKPSGWICFAGPATAAVELLSAKPAPVRQTGPQPEMATFARNSDIETNH